MNKKAVVDELKRTLELGEPRTTVLEEEVRLLLNNRDRLNSYCQAVNTPIGESGITPYQAYGELLAVERCLSGVQLPTLDLHQFQHSFSEFRKGLAITEELQILLKRMGAPVNHPFWGSLCKTLSSNRQTTIRTRSSRGKSEDYSTQGFSRTTRTTPQTSGTGHLRSSRKPDSCGTACIRCTELSRCQRAVNRMADTL